MNKLIITHIDGRIFTAQQSDSRIVSLDLEEDRESLLGNIYIGKVKNIIKNINSAFVEIENRQMAYYNLTENKTHHFATPGRDLEKKSLCAGDEIIVQVYKDAVKTKEPVVTSNLSFTGKYCVLTADKKQISFSSKITDSAWKQEALQQLNEEKEDDFGIIVRTNARRAEFSQILTELKQLKLAYRNIIEAGYYRTCYSLLMKDFPPYIKRIRDTYSEDMGEIVTDDAALYEEIKEYLSSHQPEDLEKLRLYSDSMVPLKKIYSLEKAIEDTLARNVWLKSGGYLVIDHTEAMTVIDVNTGKYAGKKNIHDTIMKINLEAAEEISYQLRLRNLSGIIMIDFIDMETREDKELLLKTLSDYCAKDPVKTTVVDITKLGLVEVTRKKIRKPFYEQMGRRR